MSPTVAELSNLADVAPLGMTENVTEHRLPRVTHSLQQERWVAGVDPSGPGAGRCTEELLHPTVSPLRLTLAFDEGREALAKQR